MSKLNTFFHQDLFLNCKWCWIFIVYIVYHWFTHSLRTVKAEWMYCQLGNFFWPSLKNWENVCVCVILRLTSDYGLYNHKNFILLNFLITSAYAFFSILLNYYFDTRGKSCEYQSNVLLIFIWTKCDFWIELHMSRCIWMTLKRKIQNFFEFFFCCLTNVT